MAMEQKGDTFVGGAFSGILPDSPLLTDPRAAARSINDGEDRCVRTVSWYRFAVRYLKQEPYAQRASGRIGPTCGAQVIS
jgi:hypothetical protein